MMFGTLAGQMCGTVLPSYKFNQTTFNYSNYQEQKHQDQEQNHQDQQAIDSTT